MATVTITQTYPNESQRVNITAPDPDASVLPPWSLGSAKGFRLGANCGQPNATLALRLYFLDGNGRIISVVPVTFSTSQPPDWGATCTGTSSVESWWPTMGAKNLVQKVDAISPGSTWNTAAAWAD